MQFGQLADDVLHYRTVVEIQKKVIIRSGRNAASRIFQARNDKDTIAGWKSDLGRILQVFNVRSVNFAWSLLTASPQTELAMNTHVAVYDIRHDVSKIREEIGSQIRQVSTSRIRSVDNWRMLTIS